VDVDAGLGLVRLEEGTSIRVEGHEVAVDGDEHWAATFEVELDEGWRTRHVEIAVVGNDGPRELLLESDGEGNWHLNGGPAAHLEGCLDVDIAATPFTNTFVIRRLALPVGGLGEVRAAWVGVPNLDVVSVDQTYVHLEPRDGTDRYEYRVAGSDEGWVIEVDEDGVAVDYQGFAHRVRP
jgi:hypothetical protein